MPLFALLAAALPTTAPVHALPLWMQSNHPAIAVTLEGRPEPLRFVVDSAAGATLVDGRVARRYGLEDTTAPVSQAQGASAQGAELRRLRSTRWQLGSLQFEASGVQADLGNLANGDAPAIDGIIGNDITARWDTRWDFAGGTLALWQPGTLGNGAGCQPNALPHRGEGLRDFAIITVQLGQPQVPAIAVVDTGAAQTVLNLAAARALGLRIDGSDARVRVRAKGTEGLGGQPQPTWLHDLPVLASAGWQHPAMEVRISALSVFRAIGLEDRPALILGADALRDGQVDISAGAERICLRRQAGG
ncbi:aspartyl protease family protein [Stenotrophomonas sp. 24(2023)]|uniref:aspartyl protease family protein n=1 Tax=Stenotrophomonas sp. 24(2023) TaxID=3068324 RepID=UPI0027E1F68D|nr:aspartyl protease family protein [Stenotrophomonas sp. 24(2023)]WMJ70681.1 aspartyl protease family protein [Stenotrophomonas sp. 24(2023)]